MSDDPFDLAAEIATLVGKAAAAAVVHEVRGETHRRENLVKAANAGVAAIKSGEVSRMQRQVQLLRVVAP